MVPGLSLSMRPTVIAVFPIGNSLKRKLVPQISLIRLFLLKVWYCLVQITLIFINLYQFKALF
jgi:hypothetical protein